MLLLILALTWGSSFILMHRGLVDGQDKPVFTPAQVAALRLSMAGLVLLPISIGAIRKVKREDWKWIAVVGIVGSGIPAFLFTNAQSHLQSGITGILNSLTPLFTLVVGFFLFNKKFVGAQVLGVVLGFVGAALLIATKHMDGENDWPYALLVVLATLSYGISVNIIPSRLIHMNSLHISALSLLFTSIPCGIYVAYSGALQVPAHNPAGWASLGYIAILACMGTAVATILYFRLAKDTGALFASSVAYLMPLVAVGWGVADGERITMKHLGCAAIILAGVYLVNSRKKPAG